MSSTQVNDLKICGKTSETVAWTKTLKRTFEKITFYQGLVGYLRIKYEQHCYLVRACHEQHIHLGGLAEQIAGDAIT